jgi:hypothetical protein
VDNSRGTIWASDLEQVFDRFPNPGFPVDVVDEVYDYGDQIHVDLKGFVREDTAYELADFIADTFRLKVRMIH